MEQVKRLFVEKMAGFDIEAQQLWHDIRDNLGLCCLENLRIVNRYDVANMDEAEFSKAKHIIFSEPNVDNVYDEVLTVGETDRLFAVEYLPGQYDQRADWAEQCGQILTQKDRPRIVCAKVIILSGDLNDDDFNRIKAYYINPVESREANLSKPDNLELQAPEPEDVAKIEGFIDKSINELSIILSDFGLAMSIEDLAFCQNYFKETEGRNPTLTEIRLIDTYWSDHCRHTTFNTQIKEVAIAEGHYTKPIQQAYADYSAAREYVYGDAPKEICLMDIAVMGMKELKKRGFLADLDESDEINACSIVVPIDVDGKMQEWLIMFKNETHNHPTEIEPFGGAATCLGGAIRDPLSGRSYVYQAMRVTGSGDPRVAVEKTLPGKLPQRKITIGAAQGYSSYGNQIGLATGQVTEFYDEKFVAKRMEIGAVIGAVPRENVRRQTPTTGDIVLLVGGRTGRDGCGGATGSSKEHTCDSLQECGAEVQKGNAPTERKIQRLFRNPAVSRLIKRCNDFGAGGVAVAIGELTDSIEINLDAVPKKYEGLDGTELAISESQERMAVLLASDDLTKFMQYANAENLEATLVAKVTADRRLKMIWRGKTIVNISRDFLDTNGVRQVTNVKVTEPDDNKPYFGLISDQVTTALPDLRAAWLANLQDLNVCSQRGLVERFDSTIGAGSVLIPFGGTYQATPTEGMVAKIPLMAGETNTATVMTCGYSPKLATWSPFHGGLYAVVEAVSKIVALGGDFSTVRLSLQEYFEKLGKDAEKWGKPFGALLGAFSAQQRLGIPAIGGKDSMSGTFMDITVPPTLVAFAVSVMKADKAVSPEFKTAGNRVVLLPCLRDEYGVPDFALLKKTYKVMQRLIEQKAVAAAGVVRIGGIAATVSKMCFGNRIGIEVADDMTMEDLFAHNHGSLVMELADKIDVTEELVGLDYRVVGYTQAKASITVRKIEISLEDAIQAWEEPLEKVFSTQTESVPKKVIVDTIYDKGTIAVARTKMAQPRVFIPVFPGTNCEYDSTKAFVNAGAIVENLVIRNRSTSEIEESIQAIVKAIRNSQIIMLPGGFSASDEPDGSGKFIATMFRNPRIKEAVSELLQRRDGLMLGICNGFQALIKLGLVPYGEIVDISSNDPTLTFNQIGRHVSCYVRTKVVSNLSPWFNNVKLGDLHSVAVSHGEGRFVASEAFMQRMITAGQIATQYVDISGEPSLDIPYNPNGSIYAVEGITSPDGRILGKMGHSERIGINVARNIPGNKDQQIFAAGVRYFK